jgi:hypothetical protein
MVTRIRAALVWTAAFCFAIALFFLIAKWLRVMPPTAPVAVGRVTVDGASKLRDYTSAAIFYLLVPAATIFFARMGQRFIGGRDLTATLLFAIPFWLSPFFYLTTRKEGWTLLLPVGLAVAGPIALRYYATHARMRLLLTRAMWPFHFLILTEAAGWLITRYVGTGKRIAHFPTLFLELVFILFFTAMLWMVAVIVSLTASNLRGEPLERSFARFSVGASPILLLPVLVLTPIPPAWSAGAVIGFSIVFIVALLGSDRTPNARTVRFAVAWLAIPVLLFCMNVASIASPWHWTDLFHRGESLGPASDYLRGKIPYRDVFVLHGLLDDGFLDAGLMRIFGRDQHVGVWRLIALDSLGLSAVWLLAFAVFGSIPLAAASLALALVTSVGNQRVVLEIISAIFLVGAVRSGRRWLMFPCGVFATLALFYSFETGLYSILGAVATLAALEMVKRRRAGSVALPPGSGSLVFLGGLAACAAPFLIYFALNGALGSFFQTSFVTIPSIIDAVWSLPYPKLGLTFRADPSLRSISDFILSEKLRFILNPVVLGIALIVLITRFLRRSMTGLDQLLIALTMCGIVSQRSALGRADFPHQYFSAFLIGPILVILLMLMGRRLRAFWTAGPGERAFAVLFGGVLAPILFVSLWVPDLYNARIDDMTRYRVRVAGGGKLDPVYLEVLDRVQVIESAVGQITAPADPIFDFSNQPALYFFANRPNPTRFYQIPIVSPLSHQREVILDLERSKPKLVLRKSPADFDNFDGIPNELRAAALAAYLDERYRYSTSVRGVELWERTADAPRFDVRRYLAAQRMPTEEELANARTMRLVFPAVASQRGLAGSEWRTDLILHNPYESPVKIRLRYLSRRRMDAEITVPPRTVKRFPDVVATTLGSPGSVGALALDVPAAAPPIAQAVTYDAASNARAPLQKPMTSADAASAGGEKKALLISGFPSRPVDRMNIGIVNVGRTPATFTITPLRNESWPGGTRAIRAGAEEQSSYSLGQADWQLGARVDEGLILRVDVHQGDIIAYASVVEPNGDTMMVVGVPVK